MRLYWVIISFQYLVALALSSASLMLGLNAATSWSVVVFFRNWVAASCCLLLTMLIASLIVICLIALIKILVAALAAFSAAWLNDSMALSTMLPKPALRNALSTFCASG